MAGCRLAKKREVSDHLSKMIVKSMPYAVGNDQIKLRVEILSKPLDQKVNQHGGTTSGKGAGNAQQQMRKGTDDQCNICSFPHLLL